MKKNKIVIVILIIMVFLFLAGGIMMFFDNPLKAKKDEAEEKIEKRDLTGLDVIIVDCEYGEENTTIVVGLRNSSSNQLDVNGLELAFKNASGDIVTTMELNGINTLEPMTFSQIRSTFPGDLGKITEGVIIQ